MIPVGILTASSSSSFSFLLDEYPNAAAAYSLRKLRSAYAGYCIRVQSTASGNPTLDIGFVNNVLDVTTLQTFGGVNSVSIITWYDQSGNSNNIVQISINNPLIIISGVLQTLNSKPIIYFTNKYLGFTNNINSNTNLFVNTVVKNNSLVNNGPFLASGGIGPLFGQVGGGFYFSGGLNGTFYVANNTSTALNTNYVIFTGISNSTNLFFYRNNTNIPLTKSADSYLQIFSTINIYNNGTSIGDGYISEIVIYKTDQTSNRTGINTNTNTFYTIY